MTRVVFAVGFRHLNADATAAGADFPDIEQPGIDSVELRRILEALTALASRVSYPTQPELRIVSPHGTFIVRVHDGRVRFSSWSLHGVGRELSPQQIYATITGLEAAADSADATSGPSAAGHFMPRRRVVKISLLAIGILASNCFTAWMMTRPAPEMLPPHRLMGASTGKRVLAQVTGEYATGALNGDRVLRISEKGAVRWHVIGPAGEVTDEEKFTAQVADVAGQPGLLTSTRAMIEIKDPVTLTFFGDTYRRK